MLLLHSNASLIAIVLMSDDVESITSCKSSCQSSEDDSYNIIHEDQNEQNNGCVQQKKQLTNRFALIGLYF